MELAPRTYLTLSREFLFLSPDEAVKLLHSLGDRPGAPVLGAVLTTDATPRIMMLYDGGPDERGQRRIDFVGWDDAPAASLLVQERLLARARN
jgi:hypothetical protein